MTFDPNDPEDWLRIARSDSPIQSLFPTEPIGGAVITSDWGRFIQRGLQSLKPLIAHCTSPLNNPGVSPGVDIPGMAIEYTHDVQERALVLFWVGFQQTVQGSGYMRAACHLSTNDGAFSSFGGSIMYGPGNLAGTFRGSAFGVEYTDVSPAKRKFKVMAFTDLAAGTTQIYDGALVVLRFPI